MITKMWSKYFIDVKNLEADIHLLPTFDNNSISKMWIDLVESVKIRFPLNVFIIADFHVLPTFIHL